MKSPTSVNSFQTTNRRANEFMPCHRAPRIGQKRKCKKETLTKAKELHISTLTFTFDHPHFLVPRAFFSAHALLPGSHQVCLLATKGIRAAPNWVEGISQRHGHQACTSVGDEDACHVINMAEHCVRAPSLLPVLLCNIGSLMAFRETSR